MKKALKYWLILLGLLTIEQTQAQYYSKIYPLLSGLTNGYINSVQVVDDTIFAMCYINDTTPPYNGTALFDRFDKHGVLLSQNYFTIPNRTNIAIGSSTKTNDGGVAFGGYTQGVTDTQNAIIIMKYDSHGDLQWYKEIPMPDSSAFRCIDLIQDRFSNYYFTGFFGNYSAYTTHSYVAKADSLGNLISFKILSDSNFSNYTGGLCINHSGNIVLGGGYGNANPNNFTANTGGYEIYELDTGLNLIQHVMGADSLFHISAEYIQETNDGGYICGDNYLCYIDTQLGKNVGSVSKLDSNFQVVWTTNTGPCSVYTFFYGLTLSPDGNFIAIGQSYDDTDTTGTHMNGWIVKFGQNGDILWNRLYRGITSDGINGDNNVLYTIAFMSDSSILCAGQAESLDLGVSQANQLGWLLHLDTAGCLPDSNSCGLPDGIVPIPQSISSVKVYPNPANDILNVTVSTNNTSTISICDLLGQSVYGQSFISGEHTVALHTNLWQAGMYCYKITSDEGQVMSGKFIVEH